MAQRTFLLSTKKNGDLILTTPLNLSFGTNKEIKVYLHVKEGSMMQDRNRLGLPRKMSKNGACFPVFFTITVLNIKNIFKVSSVKYTLRERFTHIPLPILSKGIVDSLTTMPTLYKGNCRQLHDRRNRFGRDSTVLSQLAECIKCSTACQTCIQGAVYHIP